MTLPVVADQRGPLAIGVLAVAVVALVLGAQLGGGVLGLSALVTGAILLAAAAIIAGQALRARHVRAQARATVTDLIAHDTASAYLVGTAGDIILRNGAARQRTGDPRVTTIAQALADLVANPAAVMARLHERLDGQNIAREDMVTRRGHLRLSVQRLSDGDLLWRIEPMVERAAARAGDAVALPMVTAGPSGTILYMNDAARRIAGGRVRALDRLFLDGPVQSGQVHQIDGLDGPVDCLVAEVPGQAGRREIYLLPAAAGADMRPAPGWDAVESLPVPILKISPQGEILGASRDARNLLPMAIGRGQRLSDLLEGLGRPVIDWVREVVEGRGSGQPQFLRGTGTNQETFLRVSLSLSGTGDDRHLIAVLNDVTELKSLEAQFVQSQKMQAIGQLAGGVAHDFNNLLTAISGHCDLLLLRHDQGDPDYGDLIQIHQNTNRAASLVGQLLAFSRKQNLMPEVLDLRDTLSDLTHLLNRLVGEKMTLVLRHEPGLRPIRADKRQLEQVLMNLVVNARDAMPDGGDIRISTRNCLLSAPLERDRATVPAGDYVIVTVADQGCGIPSEQLPKIFEPFFTTKRPGEGTGLGLSTAYGIVKQTGGFIFAESSPGEGTVFTLYFPTTEDLKVVAPDPVPKGAAPSVSRGDGIILLVEDEAPVRAFASRALQLRGYSVLEADCAESALALLADPAIEVDVFVTDVIMPGKDGPTWVREALASRPDTKVIFVSGYAEDAFAEQKALIPNSVFLPKPFSLTDLTSLVHRQLQ